MTMHMQTQNSLKFQQCKQFSDITIADIQRQFVLTRHHLDNLSPEQNGKESHYITASFITAYPYLIGSLMGRNW